MMAEAERAGSLVQRLKPWRIRSVAAAAVASAMIVGVLGAFCLGRVISGFTAETMTIAMLGVAGLSAAACLVCRRATVVLARRLEKIEPSARCRSGGAADRSPGWACGLRQHRIHPTFPGRVRAAAGSHRASHMPGSRGARAVSPALRPRRGGSPGRGHALFKQGAECECRPFQDYRSPDCRAARM